MEHVSVLSHGLTFSPSCDFDLYKTILDVNRFARNITVRKHFHNLDDEVCDDLSSPTDNSTVERTISFDNTNNLHTEHN